MSILFGDEFLISKFNKKCDVIVSKIALLQVLIPVIFEG